MNSYYQPGSFELYYGPMKSGKSKALMDRLSMFDYMQGINYLVIKPDVDSRNDGLYSRCYDKTKDCLFVDANRPLQITSKLADLYDLGKEYKIIAIDEIQFFGKGIDKIVMQLVKHDYHVIAAGLNTDFRGETFGQMGELLAKANKAVHLYGVCEYHDCHAPSTRTQRLINGQPASYHEPVIRIEGSKGKETYETRCIKHHEVPITPIKEYIMLDDIVLSEEAEKSLLEYGGI